MKSHLPRPKTSEAHEGRLDAASIARRAVAIIAAGAALFGILSQRPVLSVAWRSAVVLAIGVCAIHLAERVTNRVRGTTPRGARGGQR